MPTAFGEASCSCPDKSSAHLSDSQMLQSVRHVEMDSDRMGDHVNIAGTAQFLLSLGKSGHVLCAQRLSGNPIATQLLMNSMAKWRFEPFREAGSARKVCGRLNFKFQIVEGISTVEAASGNKP